ncbi:hypothetical protein [Dyella acidiphila]|uniref:Apea-like HEPN domain-containing protein n=1 Tax=Dyella acidiphila TaxID=2775866 RepID=A0ABR9GDM8_9GAMM|nr:hypothetical protein [Dyella acidiphila]MBE1162127.1 hypothetical protein [Dyella acidiphila]
MDTSDIYLSLSGTELRFSSQSEELAAEYILQRSRHVWAVTDTHPYIAIDEEKLRSEMVGVDTFVLLTDATLFQNISQRDLRSRLVSALVGPGVTASPSSSNDIIVEGQANPKAHLLCRANRLLHLGTHPFAAMGTRYVAVDPNRIFQRSIGKLVGGKWGAEPDSNLYNFKRLAELVHRFHHVRLGQTPSRDSDLHSQLLDEIFIENAAVLAVIEYHHANSSDVGPKYDYEASEQTRYGRLVHNQRGEPLIETSFALLHYEKALHEFDALKRAKANGELEGKFMHGIYCVIAIAACVEAVANRLKFEVTGQHPIRQESGDAVGRINFAARELASTRNQSFNGLGGRQPEFKSLDRVRVLRNSFMHATEEGAPVDSTALTSVLLKSVDEDACRVLLRDLRLAVAFVYDQLPWIVRPINTAPHVKLLNGLEVP